MRLPTTIICWSLFMAIASITTHADGTAWDAPDRAAKVATLIPGRSIAALSPQTLFADWTAEQLAKWADAHPDTPPPADAYQVYADTAPTDAELLADFPRHIAPLARVREGTPTFAQAEDLALYTYCPFCQAQAMKIDIDPANPYHGSTSCCGMDLYGHAADYPAGYALAPTETAGFLHLDDTTVQVPCTVYTDRDGVVWELYIKTVFDQQRWLDVGGKRITDLGKQLQQTGNPLYAHKLAILLDAAADTYYGLPLVYRNEIREMSRADWEASPRPAVFKAGPLGQWNRRLPNFNRGWLNMGREHLYAEPFALARHYPAFKQVSVVKHGDPDALDKKIRAKLIRELSLTLQSVFSQRLVTNYQDAIYINMILVGVLAEDDLFTRFYVPAHETILYNHTYRDGLNGEGAPNYMGMPCGYFLPYLGKEDGWLRFQPTFLAEHPFYQTAMTQLWRLTTVRGQHIEFGDQHVATWPPYGLKPDVKADNEQRGSVNWADYGVGIIRVGGPDHRLELAMDYTSCSLHNGQDALALECWVDGVPVLRHGGYACWWWSAPLQEDRPEIKALMAMDFPHKIAKAHGQNPSWSWNYTHSAICHNAPVVDGKGTGLGWGRDDRGYGQVVTFKGGEAPGQPGADFQILDVVDEDAWPQSGSPEVTDFRRTVIAGETPAGRGYALDILTLKGGAEHVLFNNAWGERADSRLPDVTATFDDLEDVLPGGGEERGKETSHFRQVRHIRQHARTAGPWEVTWATDYAAYAPRQADGTFVRPIPEDDGKVRLRQIGLAPAGDRDLYSAKGPWVARLMQPLPEGKKTDGYLVFEDARDLVVERHGNLAEAPDVVQQTLFVHVLEGFREGEESVIAGAELVPVDNVEGDARDLLAVRLRFVDGSADVVLYQSAPGVVRLPDGTTTDAPYARFRTTADGKRAVETCRGTFVRGNGMETTFPGGLTGTIVDLVGDLTGTRQESALIVATATPWPTGEALAGRQLLVTFESDLRHPSREGYLIERVTDLGDGRIRIDLADHAPLIESWHDVFDIPADPPGSLRTIRALFKHSNNSWYDGLTVWFPEKDRTYTIAGTAPMSGGIGGETITLVGGPDLAADGIVPGDWLVVYGIRPGLKVDVASQWRSPAQ